MKKRLIGVAVAVLVLVTGPMYFFGPDYLFRIDQFLAFTEGEDPWDPTPIVADDGILFSPHYSGHPGYATFLEKVGFAAKIDMDKTVRKSREGNYGEQLATFPHRAPIGEQAPDFELLTIDGDTVNLSDFRGRIVAFQFVAMTCPPARLQVEKWERLYDKYDHNAVVLLDIYSRERHPGEPGYRDFVHSKTDADRIEYAHMMSELTDVPVVVDGISETALQSYGMVPNPAFVVDREGRLVFKAQWSDVRKVESVIDSLLEYYEQDPRPIPPEPVSASDTPSASARKHTDE